MMDLFKHKRQELSEDEREELAKDEDDSSANNDSDNDNNKKTNSSRASTRKKRNDDKKNSSKNNSNDKSAAAVKVKEEITEADIKVETSKDGRKTPPHARDMDAVSASYPLLHFPTFIGPEISTYFVKCIFSNFFIPFLKPKKHQCCLFTRK